MKTDNRIDMFLGPSATFAGYVFLLVGTVYSFENPAGFILVIAGLFMGFSYIGTIIDFNQSRIKSYTAIFGLIKLGKWYPVNSFDKFRIYRSNRSYTSYSRGNIPLTIRKSDIRLDFMNSSGSLKVTIDRFDSFESARDEMSELIKNLHIASMEEWTKQ
ncbi:MAG: hypothetical protein GX431_00295 [Bacteroidales bacterium]|jgi:hypothetical protein|nr:hypothetical protein [Bacteroidales bacterium]